MKIGYIRTSTIDQNLDRQKQIMRDNNIELLFSEQESGKDTNCKDVQLPLGDMCFAFLGNHNQLHGPSGSVVNLERFHRS